MKLLSSIKKRVQIPSVTSGIDFPGLKTQESEDWQEVSVLIIPTIAELPSTDAEQGDVVLTAPYVTEGFTTKTDKIYVGMYVCMYVGR